VRAAITGVVQRRDVNAGLLVSSSSHLFTLVDPTRLIANLPIPHEDVHRITRPEIPVEFQFDALPGQTLIGVVEAMNPSVDPASGLIRVRARLPDQAVGLVRPGMFARARIVIESRPDAVLVSKRAVAYDEGRAFVFSTAGGVARKHLIEVGASTEDELEVVLLDGAPPDLALDLIVVGQDNLRDGDPVAVTAAAAESAS
jgi:membrane fusion protein (multidrug efflux system)